MKITDCITEAEGLIAQNGLDGWTFTFDRAVNRFGQANFTRRTISLSRALVVANPPERVRLTLVHELAHALVGMGHHHDAVWQRVCIELGGDGLARYTLDNTTQPKMKYEATCPCRTYRRMRVKAHGFYRCPDCRTSLTFTQTGGFR